MVKWEYCLLEAKRDAEVTYFGEEGSRSEAITGGMNNDQHGEVKKKIANLGQQGWELVAIQQASNSLEFYFKKPAGER